MQFQLEQSQWLPPDELLRRQAIELGKLIRHAYGTVPFYRKRFDEAGLHPDTVRGPEQWVQIPLLTRRDIQQAGRDIHCANGPTEHGPISKTVTSGSSGQPVTTLGTTVTRLMTTTLLLRQHLWHRRDFRLKLVAIRSQKNPQPNSPRELALENWGMGTMEIVRTGPAVTLDVHASVEEQAEFLLRHDPDYLNTYPSVVLALTRHFARSDRRLTRLREVRTFGEVLDPAVRIACREVWGVRIVDTYSTEEMGDIAMQCPDNEHYHVQAENVLVEVLDDTGRACPPGETGRVVVTALHNYAMPLIRYDIGDYAEVGNPCSCGRGLPVLKRIVGRQRNMFLLPDGRQVWPSLEQGVGDSANVPPVQQFQLIQRTVSSLELLVVAPRLFTAVEEQALRGLVDHAVGCSLDLKITHVQSIPRGAGGKYEDVRSEVSLQG